MACAAAVALGCAAACALAFAVLAPGGAARAADETRAVRMRLGTREEARGRPDVPITIIEFTDYQCRATGGELDGVRRE